MRTRRPERRDCPYLIQALERIAVLREDCKMTSREIAELGGVSERALRDWTSGRVRRLNRQRVEPFERAVLNHGRRPWSEHHFGMANEMWQVLRHGGQQAVIDALRAKCKSRSGSFLNADKRKLADARISPGYAEDVSPSIYRDGGVLTVARDFGHYVSFMKGRFSAAGFPHPSTASPDDWTTVLLLIQFFRDTGSGIGPNAALVKRLRTWLSTGCTHNPYTAWSQILNFRLVEEQLAMNWQVDSSVPKRRYILDKLRWFDRVEQYTALVQRNYTVARNALATASAVHDRQRYPRWHADLLSQDPRLGIPSEARSGWISR